MDPLAHTLVGASLAETGLGRRTALGTATLIVGANLPDIDGVAAIAGTDASLLVRRTWTHGVLALVILPALLAAAMWGIDRLLARRAVARGRDPGQPARPGALLLLAYLSVLSHPFLDWLNVYGVRLLAPFDFRFFYGDALFIIDPWLWLLAAAPVVLARANHKISIAAWVVLAALATALVTRTELVPSTVKMAFCVGVAAVVFLRIRGRALPVRIVAMASTGLVAVYIALMLVGSHLARGRAVAFLAERGLHADVLVALPVAARPFHREIVARVGDRYQFLEVPCFGSDAVKPSYVPVPVGRRDAVVRAALASPAVRGFARWMRLPAYDTRRTDDGGYRVTVRDMRYARMRPSGIGAVVVELDADLRVR